jgi:nicotinate phosphoribosyltransferase
MTTTREDARVRSAEQAGNQAACDVAGPPSPSAALLTDHYELTMLAAALRSGLGDRRATFELFARRLPRGRRYGVALGLGRLVATIGEFRFGPAELEFLCRTRVVDDDTAAWLAAYRFSGSIDAYAEGEVFFPSSPLVTVDATFAESIVLETVALSILNHDSAVGAAAARMRATAGTRSLIEMGTRRTGEHSAHAAARAAWICGFDGTSNLEAGRRFGIPTLGTAAHAFSLGHLAFHPDDPGAAERAAFAAQLDAQGTGTTLLVDTFDTGRGVANAIAVARAAGVPGPGAIRIDSGDLADEARRARATLDAAGAAATRIIVTGDLDEYAMAELAAAPIDGYGAGTHLVQGSGHPTAGLVYKLVAVDDGRGRMVPVAKRSLAKANVGGRKTAWRALDDRGTATAEVLTIGGRRPDGPVRALQVRVIEDGRIVHDPPLPAVRAHHLASLAELPPVALDITAAEPALPTRLPTS